MKTTEIFLYLLTGMLKEHYQRQQRWQKWGVESGLTVHNGREKNKKEMELFRTLMLKINYSKFWHLCKLYFTW